MLNIFILASIYNFMLSCVEHEKGLITSEPGVVGLRDGGVYLSVLGHPTYLETSRASAAGWACSRGKCWLCLQQTWTSYLMYFFYYKIVCFFFLSKQPQKSRSV